MGVACQISVEKPSAGVFKAGDTVAGIVKYFVDEPIEVKGIELSLIGKGEVSFLRLETGIASGTHLQPRRGTENYISNTISILQNAAETQILQPGFYENTFEFILPNNIPSSYKSREIIGLGGSYKSSITYLIKMEFKKVALFSLNIKFAKEIVVYGNLNRLDSNEPKTYNLQKSLFKLFSSRNEVINLKAHILKCFLTPGENVDLILDVSNDSDTTILSITCELVRKTVLYANSNLVDIDAFRHFHYKYINRTVEGCVFVTRNIPGNTTDAMNAKIPINPDLYSIHHSTIIKVEYVVKVTVNLPFPHTDVSLEIPVVIGEPDREVVEIEELDDDGNSTQIAQANDRPPSYWEVMEEVK